MLNIIIVNKKIYRYMYPYFLYPVSYLPIQLNNFPQKAYTTFIYAHLQPLTTFSKRYLSSQWTERTQ